MNDYEIYHEAFQSKEDIIREFDIPESTLEGAKILFAYYDQGEYEGVAIVILERDNQLYEVNGSHCSCFGLEEQWEEEETSYELLHIRTQTTTYKECYPNMGNALSNFVKSKIGAE